MSAGNGPCSCVFTTSVRAPGSTVTSVVAKNDSKRDHRKLFDIFRYKLFSFKKLFDTTLVLFKISPYSQKLSSSLVSWYHIVKKNYLPNTTHTQSNNYHCCSPVFRNKNIVHINCKSYFLWLNSFHISKNSHDGLLKKNNDLFKPLYTRICPVVVQ